MPERADGKIFLVDDQSIMREALEREAKFAGVQDVEVFKDEISVISRLEQASESEETISLIVSDGLNGGWKQVIDAARAANVPAIVLSADSDLREQVEETGTRFIDKVDAATRTVDLGAIFSSYVNPTELS